MRKHAQKCDCYECSDPYIKQLNQKYSKADRVDASGRMDNADSLPIVDKKSASYFLDATLVARKPVDIRKTPSDTATIVNSYPKGSNVGKIYSYVVRDGQVWWDVNYFSGAHAGWVKHDSTLFDKQVIEQTNSQTQFDNQQAEIKKKLEEPDNPISAISTAIGGTSEFVSSIFSNLKWIVLAAVILTILYFGYKMMKQ